MDDTIRPTEQAFMAMFERGFRTWSNLRDVTTTTSEFHPPLQDYLHQLETAFPRQPCFPQDLVLDLSCSNLALAKGTSSWKTDLGCGLPSFEQELLVPVATNNPTTLIISDTQQSSFNIAQCLDANDDHTTILILAWTYILSARWAEIIPNAHSPEYTEYVADCVHTDTKFQSPTVDSSHTVVYLGEVDDDAKRWWSAILAIEGGWDASIKSDKGASLHSPWHTKIVSDKNFALTCTSRLNSLPSQKYPPSFTTVVRYLSEYCQFHGVHDQSQAALAATLLIPAVRFDNRVIQLHTPNFRCQQGPNENHRSYQNPQWGTDLLGQLDKLLTLSCNAIGVKALLTSVFFEPGVECNLCGAWLQGTLEFLNSVKDQNLLLQILIARDPTLAFLWIGAFITGFRNRVLQEARGGWWKIDLLTAAWTSTLMSFIQEPVSIQPVGTKQISRADECRLLYLSHDLVYVNPPLFPFAPFGSSTLEDTNIDVREHAGCETGHSLQYQGFKWLQTNDSHEVSRTASTQVTSWRPKHGQSSTTTRYNSLPITYNNLDIEDCDISEMTTHNIFVWLRGEDGFPVAERAIREHEWINNLDSDDDEAYMPTGDALSSAGGSLHGWLIKSMTTRSASL